MSSTIVAIASASQPSGVGVIRLSGPGAKSIAECHLSKTLSRERHLYFAHFKNPETHETVDDLMAVWMCGPRSYTGEDVVELYPHGSVLILNRLLELLIAGGATLAKAGEFTQRAFLNGKLDLTQAEAVSELVMAESEAELKRAQKRLRGELGGQIDTLYTKIAELLAECEADIDFPDENLPLSQRQNLLVKIEGVGLQLHELLHSYQSSEVLKKGVNILFLGPPNSGKSSLFNALLNKKRALVSDFAGTTRDFIEDQSQVGPYKVNFLDAAGVRKDSQDPIENMGIASTWALAKEADFIVVLLARDASAQEKIQLLDELHRFNLSHPEQSILWLESKADLPAKAQALGLPQKTLSCSIQDPQSISQLREQLQQAIETKFGAGKDFGGIQNMRQKTLIHTALERFDSATARWQNSDDIEVCAADLRESLEALAQVLGKTEPQEDILDEIFSKFCVGK